MSRDFGRSWTSDVSIRELQPLASTSGIASGISGNARVTKDVPGYPGMSKIIQGCPGISFWEKGLNMRNRSCLFSEFLCAFPGYPGVVFRDIRGYPCISKNIRGDSGKSQDMQGYPWISGISRDIQGYGISLRPRVGCIDPRVRGPGYPGLLGQGLNMRNR